MTSDNSTIRQAQRGPATPKKPRIVTVILILISVVLALALVFSLIVIDKLNKNNLFSKSIFLNNDYYLGSIARSDISDDTDDAQIEAPAYADNPFDAVEAATNAVLKKVSEYIKENRDVLEKNLATGKDFNGNEYEADKTEYYYDPSLLKGDYSVVQSEIYVIYCEYGICDATHRAVEAFLADTYGVKIRIADCSKKVINVPYLSQEGILPNGCEAVSATMLLQWAGVNISATDFVDNYLECRPVKIKWGCRYGPNPKLAYAGDPYSTDKGYGCYAPVIVSALNRVENRKFYAKNISGLSLSDIREQYIKKDIPVAVWVTVEMKEISRIIQWQSQDGSESFLYPSNEHCMVLVGYDEENYYFNDPYGSAGLVSYPAEDCVLAYNSLGMQAVAVIAKP